MVFKDSKGREWALRLDVRAAYRFEDGPRGRPLPGLLAEWGRAEEKANAEGAEFADERARNGNRELRLMEALGGLSGLVALLWAMVGPEAQARGITREDLAESLAPAGFGPLFREVSKALSDFFQEMFRAENPAGPPDAKGPPIPTGSGA